jgi:hypothetical protein
LRDCSLPAMKKNYQRNGENDQADGVCISPNALYARSCIAIENAKLFNDINWRKGWNVSERAGVPVDVDQWGWSCGFYHLSHRDRRAEGTAKTFAQARADFEAAWR